MNYFKVLIFFNFLLISFSISASSWITKKGSDNFNKDESCNKSLSINQLNKKSDYFIDIEEYEKAFSCSIIAANQKDTYAEGSVGWLYQNGYGVDQDYDKALTYLKRAKNGGSTYAMNLLAEHYIQGWGVTKNFSKGISYYTKSANKGDDYAQGQLGYYYYYGDGVEENKKIAHYWFLKSAEQGNTYSESWLGHLYLFGEGTDVDLENALKFNKLAADKGDEFAQSNLGYIYEWGEGVEKNIDKAIEFYSLAADQGNDYSKERLEILLTENIQEKIDDDSSSSKFITKKIKDEDIIDKKIEEKINNANESQVQAKFIPIEEFTEIITKTKLKKNYTSDSQTIMILDQGIEIYAIKELVNENILGTWVNIEVEIENQVLSGFVLKDKIALKEQVPNKPDNQKFDIEWGEYYAIVIGNNIYDQNNTNLSNLSTAINDAETIGKILKNKYGFKTEVVKNATRDKIFQTLKKYRSILTENDNLLIYYAGHGTIEPMTQEGYWLPVDAIDNQEWTWFGNRDLVSQTKTLNAKHIIVIADSCFSGSIFDVQDIEFRGSFEDNNSDLESVFYNMNRKKTRIAITSGNKELVPDRIENSNHSPFATVLIDILSSNNDVLPAGYLFNEIVITLPKFSKRQTPVYGEFDIAHEKTGDFLFVPTEFR